MVTRRAVIVFVASTGMVVGLALPAPAQGDAVQTKRIEGPSGRSGTVARYADQQDSGIVHSVTMTAIDADGRSGRCTETWMDYHTKPHQHLNPGVLVNCSGGTGRVSGAVATRYQGVVGMSVIVCEVPDTSGPIIRNESNCRGGLGAMSLHSGRRYRDFEVDADRAPGGVRVWRV